MIAPLPENGLVGVLPDDLPSVVTVVCKQTAGDYHPRTGLDHLPVFAMRRR
jgi:hypothetical protein